MRNKKLALALIAILAVFGLMLVFIPAYPPAVDAAAWRVTVYDFFVEAYDIVVGEFFFYLSLLAALFLAAYMLLIKPLRVMKGKKKELSDGRKVLFGLIAAYIVLLIAVPFFTLSDTASAGLTTFYDHFVTVKDIVSTDWAFLAGFALILFGIYWLLTKKK